MSSSSDSDGCNIYTKAAENIKKKRALLKMKLEDFEDLNVSGVEERKPILDLTNNDSDADVSQQSTKNKVIGSRKRCNSKSISLPAKSPKKRRRRSKRKTTSKKASKSNVTQRGVLENPPVGTGMVDSACIILDDDSDFYKDSPSSLKNKIIDDSILSSDPELADDPVVISVEWCNGKTISRKQYDLDRDSQFETILKELATLEKVPLSRILLERNGNMIKPSDTPRQLGLAYHGAFTGSLMESDINYDAVALLNETETNSEEVISVQLKFEFKKTLNCRINKHQKMSELYKKCSDELNCEAKFISLTFDGDYLDPNVVASSLDLEDGDMFCVSLKKVDNLLV